jgi:hypothetical protein
MVAEQSFDVSAVPELARLADEVRRTHRPRLLRRGGETIALLPLPNGDTLAAKRRSTRRRSGESVVANGRSATQRHPLSGN